MPEVLTSLKNVLSFSLFEIGGRALTLGTLLLLAVLIVATLVIARLARAAALGALRRRELAGKSTLLGKLIHHTIVVVGIAVVVDTAGIELKTLFAASAVFAVGLGLAMQNIAQNFLAGIILLIERTIKAGDVLEVEGKVVRVQELRIRTTLVRTREDEELIIPNATLAQSTVKSFTLADSLYRFHVAVGVSYGDDMKEVRRVLEETARSVDWRDVDREPQILLADFGSSSVVWEVHVWTREPWLARVQQAALREAIWYRLKAARITLAFPQIDVHVDAPLIEALAGRHAPVKGAA